MTENELTLEKINSDRITHLEEKVDRKLEHLEQKVDRIITAVSTSGGNGKNGGAWKDYTILGLIVTLILTLIGGTWQRLNDHTHQGHHPKAAQEISNLMARTSGIESDLSRLDHKTENFKDERERISENFSSISRLDERMGHIEGDFNKVERMSNSFFEKGEMFEKLKWIEDQFIDWKKGKIQQ